MAKAFTMLPVGFVGEVGSCLPEAGTWVPPRIMTKRAEAKLPKMAKNAIATSIFIDGIIG
jgi:hypothetical protein